MIAMGLMPLEIRPGVFRNGTRYQARGRWWDSNLVRWYNQQLRPVGGWQRVSSTPASGVPRALLSWLGADALTGNIGKNLAIGTNTKLYQYNGGSLLDITPAGFVPGRADSSAGLGYGTLKYGDSTYGTPRVPGGGSLVLDAAMWTLDNWGDFLVGCCTSDGKLYEWPADPLSLALPIDGAPVDNSAVLVTDQRHLMALGAGGNPRSVKWSSEEDNTDWVPTEENTAGGFQLKTTGKLVCGIALHGQVLLLTDVDAHLGQYVGRPFVWGFDQIARECGIIGPQAICIAGDMPVWMSGHGQFYYFDGSGVRPLRSDVQKYIEDDINTLQAIKSFACIADPFPEAWFFYPSRNSNEPNRYASWNWEENHWAIGQLDRSAGTRHSAWPHPIYAAPDGMMYQHEVGYLADGLPRLTSVFAECGPLNIGEGERFMDINQLLPDEGFEMLGRTQYRFISRATPNGPRVDWGPFVMDLETGYMDARISGRGVQMRVEAIVDDDWRIGRFRADVESRGKL